MEQKLILEEECMGCGKSFDLSYDLDTKKQMADEEMSEVIKKVEKNKNSLFRHLCWDCRQVS